jgi:putative peptidoglycan lipid II flippase
VKKFTKLSRAALLVAVSFGINKVIAILRQLIIARQFGLSSNLDVFNVANNVPDMLYSLISGGALAVAIIPVLTEVMTRENRDAAWRVFSQIANFAFLVTALLSLLVAIFAEPLIKHPLGIAPGFTPEQQALSVDLMRLNLFATLIFSMAGLLIAGLQANQHFLLPAIGPILYNVGQIFGAIVLAPETGYSFGPVTLPAYGLGVYGLVYGVLIGSAFYFLIQIPGLVIYKFKWTPKMNLRDADVKKILFMLGPRVASMFLYQLTFIARDNLASRLPLGSVSALTYGWMILQVPETLIGTAIGTALLPTISEMITKNQRAEFAETINRVIRVFIALAIPSAMLLSIALPPLLDFAFGFDPAGTSLMLWVTRAFLVGLLSHCLLELGARIFFAQQNATIPFLAAAINLVTYIAFGLLLLRPLEAVGVALADAAAFTAQSAFLLGIFSLHAINARKRAVEMNETPPVPSNSGKISSTTLRTLIGSVLGSLVIWLILRLLEDVLPGVILGTAAAAAGFAVALPFIFKEIKILVRL